MDISKFAKRPELIKIEINDATIVENYGDIITFYIYDNIDINTYFEFYKSQADQDGDKLNSILRKLIFNEQGKNAIADDQMLPIDLALAALHGINEQLGKSRTKPSTPTTGTQQD